MVAVTVGESFEETPETVKHISRKIHSTGALCVNFDSEHSAVESVPIPDKVVEHHSRIIRSDAQSVEAHVTRNR